MAKNIKPRSADYSQWYLDVIKAARLADYAPVKGCMVIRPEGFAIWESIQRQLDRRFKDTGHLNAYFPLLIPQSFLAKEAAHVEGFAMECAIVTHTRLEKDENNPGGLKPASPLEEPLIIRPTSETLFGHMYSQWIQSYRDLPMLINQWCNVMRWELRTRLFLRTAEFLWQEGHTAHETEAEAKEETLRMLDVYAEFAENVLAIPVVKGAKTDSEKFPGAVTTYCIEGLMQDGKALQAGTSHYLGQNFSKAFDVKFLGRDQQQQFAYTTSWGVSTRLIGAVIMAHSDDEGLILPPRLAPDVAAIVPIFRSDEDKAKVGAFVEQLLAKLTGPHPDPPPKYRGREGRETGTGSETEVQLVSSGSETGTDPVSPMKMGYVPFSSGQISRVFFDRLSEQRIVADWRDLRPGEKHYYWEQQGVPFRLEIGPRDVDAGTFVLKGRIDGSKEVIRLADVSGPEWLREKLETAHVVLFERARKFRDDNTRFANTLDDMKQILEKHGGFVRCYFEPDRDAEAKIKEQTKATVRCIPFDQPEQPGKSIFDGRETRTQVLFAVAY
jgi:prolyl-tRNA synthetase